MEPPKMELEDWLDDLCVRFIINLPQEDLSSVARICFQVEEAQWFYEDFIRPLDPTLPSMTLRTFCLRIFQHCPLLSSFSVDHHTKAFEEFLQYKTRVPVRGAIMLNEAMDSVVLVKGWKKSANWTFPRGKINKDEDDLECAIREVYEETGFDIRKAGLVPNNESVKYIEINMREQQVRHYVFRNVPMDTYFEPRTRKEISKIQWYNLSELPAFRKRGAQGQNDATAAVNANKFYMVAPFLVPLKKWVREQLRRDAFRTTSVTHLAPHAVPVDSMPEEEPWTAATDSGAAPAAPAAQKSIDTLEGASKELRRLLKMQPPTAGTQQHHAAAPEMDKAGALLAMLQSKGTSNGYSAGDGLPSGNPRTPMEQVTHNPQLPTTPRHHHPHHVPLAATGQQPPSFPLPSHMAAPRLDPAMQQSHYGASTEAKASAGHLELHRAALIHPQPLPPTVQPSLLDSGRTTHLAAATAGASMASGTWPDQNLPPPAALNRPAPGADHLNSLLGIFKGGPKAASDGSKVENVRQDPRFIQATSAETQVAAPGAHAAAHYPASGSNAAVPRRDHPSAGSFGQGFDSHRTSLLGMFKRGDSQPASSPGATGPALQEGGQSTSLLSPGVPSAHQAKVGTVDALSGSSRGAGQQIAGQFPPGSGLASLPFNPTDSFPSLTGFGSSGPPSAGLSGLPDGMGRLSIGSQPHDGRRQALSPAGKTHPVGTNAQPRSTPPAPSTIAAPGLLMPRKAPSVEQKQKLLSLFQKPEHPAASHQVPARSTAAHHGSHSMTTPGQPQPHVSTVGAQSSLGETPISPADRSFLLGYLESITHKAT